jgi:ribose 5-phosphate isomerase A
MSADLKTQAAEAALAFVKPGMRLGLGTGSTADAFLHVLGRRVTEGLDVIGVPTSERTADLATRLGIRLSTLDETPELDLTIDGADEIGPGLALIKGGGGALLREKIVAAASRGMLVIADGSKVVDMLGAFALPIEVVSFGVEATRRAIAARASAIGLEGGLTLRRSGDRIYTTDGGHLIIDASFRQIPDPQALAFSLATIPGVVEHGLFLGLATAAVIAREGGVKTLHR